MPAEAAKPPPAPGRAVTAETLSAVSDVLGRPLAEPWRRFVAMVIDLAAVALLSVLTGPWLGMATGTMLIVLFGNLPSAPIAMKAARFFCRALGALVIVLSILALGHVSLVRRGAFDLEAFTGRAPIAAMKETVYVGPDASSSELRSAVGKLEKQVEELKAENHRLHDASGSWVYQSRAFANTLGVTFGWSGVYFTLLAGFLNGRTLGKLILRTRAMKINGTAFTFFDGFVRHGGYVAGVAMGMMGFIKLLWEPNRQTVEDRIAGTVVVKV